MAGIYIHIPFCKQACHYCDFHFATSMRYKEPLLKALAKELAMRREDLHDLPIKSIYFGGGTPSLLQADDIKRLLDAADINYNLAQLQEVTLEANPDDLSKDKLVQIYQAGVQRLSIGIQTFQESLLKRINRVHNAQEALQCVQYVRQVGFTNFSIDLMYGLPGSTLASWEADIAQAVALCPPHISAYCLTIEKNTRFGHAYAQGKLRELPEKLLVAQFHKLVDSLEKAGYIQYEISNFALPGRESFHNSNYWKGIPYIGIGPSAHGFDGTKRYFNVKHNAAYISAIEAGELPATYEELTQAEKINDYIFTGLRTLWGCDLTALKMQYGDDLLERAAEKIENYKVQGLMDVEQDKIVLTRQGKLLADGIAQELFVATN